MKIYLFKLILNSVGIFFFGENFLIIIFYIYLFLLKIRIYFSYLKSNDGT